MPFKLFSQNKKFIFWLIIAIEIILIFPTIYGYAVTPDGFYYNGIHNLSPGDFHLYLSYFEQVRQGSLFFKDLYTGEAQTPNFFNPFFLFFGLIGKFFNISNIIVLLIAKMTLIPIFIIMLFLFLSTIFKKASHLRLAMIFTVFSSGLGVYVGTFIKAYETSLGYVHWPMDLWVPEFNIFLTLYHNPLYTAALTLILLIFYLFVKSVKENRIKFSVAAGLCALILFSIHPYHIPTIYAIPALFTIVLMIKERKLNFSYIKHWCVLFLFSVPSMIYQVILVFTDFIMYNRYNGSPNPLTTPWLTVLSYGFIFFFAMPSFVNFLKGLFINKKSIKLNESKLQDQNNIGQTTASNATSSKPMDVVGDEKGYLLLLTVWFLGGLLIVYLPFLRHTRRLTLGLQIPLVVFAVITLISLKRAPWYEKLKKTLNIKIIFAIVFLLLFGLSTVQAPLMDIWLYSTKPMQIYIPLEIYNGMEWLKNNSTANDVILADYVLYGNLIPGIIGRTVYIGHNPETALYEIKKQWVNEFFSKNHSESVELNFLKDNRITHIFYSDFLKAAGSWQPRDKPYLMEEYKSKKLSIFKIITQ